MVPSNVYSFVLTFLAVREQGRHLHQAFNETVQYLSHEEYSFLYLLRAFITVIGEKKDVLSIWLASPFPKCNPRGHSLSTVTWNIYPPNLMHGLRLPNLSAYSPKILPDCFYTAD